MTLPRAGILLGPTASGKTALAVGLASRLPIEVVAADSRQVYRRLDIGTAKPSPAEQAAVRHHLLDLLDLHETFDAARFAALALAACDDIRSRGRIPLVVGGAGFYLEVLRQGLFSPPYSPAALALVRRDLAGWSTGALHLELAKRDPERAAQLHPNDRYRLSRALEICIASGTSVTLLTATKPAPTHRFVEFRLVMERSRLHDRIASRTREMIAAGWVEEVRAILASGADPDLPGLRTLGYPHVIALVQGHHELARVEELVARDTRRYARAQETWFRKARDATPLAAEDPGALEALLAGLAAAFGA